MTGDDRTVTTGATGRAERVPERGAVEVRVRGEGESPGAARAAAAERAAAVRDRLADHPHERVRTTGFSASRNRRHPESGGDPPFEAVESLTVDVGPGDADGVVLAVTDEGATVESVDFAVTEATRRALREEALADAMASARRQAEALAAAESLSVGAVRSASASEFGSRRPGRGLGMEMDSGRSATDFRPGPVEVTADVEVVFELADTDG